MDLSGFELGNMLDLLWMGIEKQLGWIGLELNYELKLEYKV